VKLTGLQYLNLQPPIFMKTIVLGVIASTLLMISACKQSGEVTDKPFIEAISFVGIPNENVNFDKTKSRITVKLPAVLEGGLQPIVELSEGAKITQGLTSENTIDLSSLCGCNKSGERIMLSLDYKGIFSAYEVVVVPEGKLKAQSTNEPFTFSRKGDRMELSLPVENLYTNPHVDMLLFTNMATGRVETITADAACLNSCYGSEYNRIIFSLHSPIEKHLTPGSYTLEFNNVKFPQQLVVTN
jgi:hypothetical protein